MFINYLTVAWRNLLKHRLFTLLNLTGLSTGLACTLLICLWITDEWRMDRFHENGPRLYTVMESKPHAKGLLTTMESPAQLADVLKQEMPEVEASVVSTPRGWFPGFTVTAAGKHLKSEGLFAGKDFFDIFSYPLLMGDKKQVLADNNGIVISESMALRLFGTVNNITGRQLDWQVDVFKRPAVVAGVFKDVPGISSLQFDFILPFSAFKSLMRIGDNLEPGGPFVTWLLLKEGITVPAFNAKLTRFMQDRTGAKARTSFVAPYADNYLYGTYENWHQAGGRITYVKLFGLIGLFIVFIAAVNFMNLATARANIRMKEVGVRKTLGASRWALIKQFLGESLLLSVLSLLLAILMVWLLLGPFNLITGKRLQLEFSLPLAALFTGITLFTGLLAGSYPAFFLSAFKPVLVLKGKMVNSVSGLWARKGLVVFQFSLSVVLIVAVMVVEHQLAYIRDRNLGYQKDHVVYFNAEGKVPEHMDAFLAAVREIPGVVTASSMVGSVFGEASQPINWERQGRTENILFRPFQTGEGMLETLGIQLKEGTGFSGNYAADTSRIIFNEAAIAAMGLEQPVGKTILFGNARREIVGVVKDFNFQSLHSRVQPLFFIIEPRGGTVMLKISAGMEQDVLKRLEGFYRAYNPGYVLESHFLDEDYQALYTAEKRVGTLAGYAAALTIVISCLGVFGLAAFTAETRRREIGIRKVLGAKTAQLTLLLSKDLLRAVSLAIGIGLPLAWLMMHRWLDQFAYRSHFGWEILAMAGGATFAVTFLTVGVQTVRASLRNPVEALKAE
ncbi:FtsX-like permease family protein [Chitinophaga varians]|uniref:FtsX-like permease family protein n=1 Tax=Chitinophaga varians TaxID=2202339 RepID=A0A847RYL3_9BACT|nr:ABC transporter permease [Chitinophaga varians]NLR68193.1 FtsX-like permease family protein [Chitinophaga varians]